MKIDFDINVCGNFNLAANKEWLETNNLGGYASSTIYGLNNRRHHGLFVIPVGHKTEKTIILSKFEESIFIGNQVYELSTNQFSGGIYPDGFQYMVHFSIDPFPKFQFNISGMRVEKTIFMLHDKHVLVIRYAYKNQGPPLNFILKPMLAGRDISDLSHEVTNINTDSYLESGVVKLAPKDSVPELKIYFQKGEYIPAPLWHHNYLYNKDFRRKQNGSDEMTEDLFNPGFFSFKLEPYDTFEMFISVKDQSNLDYESLFREEKNFRRTYNPNLDQLPQVAKDIAKRLEILSKKCTDNIPLHVSNYPIDDQNTREMLFSLWGLVLLEKDKEQIKTSLLTYINFLNQGLLPAEILSRKESSKNLPADINLIFINIIYYLYNDRIDLKFIEDNLLESCQNVIEIYSKGTNHVIYQDVDGLIFSGSQSINTSWFPPGGGENGEVRYGKICEINALWYNSLKIMEFFSRETGKSKQAKKYADMAELTKKSFRKEFWNSKLLRYYDNIKGDLKEDTFSISQLFLIALPFSMLDVEKGILVLKQIEEHLLTPLGLRSLSPLEKHYKGRLESSINNHKSDYFVGSIWPWTIGMYIDAVLKLRGNNQQVINGLSAYLENLGQFFYEQGSGNISEFFEGNPPHRRNGRICYSLNLTELLRGYFTLHKAVKDKSTNYP
jgi:predicted glycogen debranching enzyme